MKKIVYFGTRGVAGHYPYGLNFNLTPREINEWGRWIDNDNWIGIIARAPGYGVAYPGNVLYTRYSFPWSVDDSRGGSHTNLFWEGEHTKEDMVAYIKSVPWLARQFKIESI